MQRLVDPDGRVALARERCPTRCSRPHSSFSRDSTTFPCQNDLSFIRLNSSMQRRHWTAASSLSWRYPGFPHRCGMSKPFVSIIRRTVTCNRLDGFFNVPRLLSNETLVQLQNLTSRAAPPVCCPTSSAQLNDFCPITQSPTSISTKKHTSFSFFLFLYRVHVTCGALLAAPLRFIQARSGGPYECLLRTGGGHSYLQYI